MIEFQSRLTQTQRQEKETQQQQHHHHGDFIYTDHVAEAEQLQSSVSVCLVEMSFTLGIYNLNCPLVTLVLFTAQLRGLRV